MGTEKKLLDLPIRNLLAIFKEAISIKWWQEIPKQEKLRRVKVLWFQGAMRQLSLGIDPRALFMDLAFSIYQTAGTEVLWLVLISPPFPLS